jgi:hypothetical protein
VVNLAFTSFRSAVSAAEAPLSTLTWVRFVSDVRSASTSWQISALAVAVVLLAGDGVLAAGDGVLAAELPLLDPHPAVSIIRTATVAVTVQPASLLAASRAMTAPIAWDQDRFPTLVVRAEHGITPSG